MEGRCKVYVQRGDIKMEGECTLNSLSTKRTSRWKVGVYYTVHVQGEDIKREGRCIIYVQEKDIKIEGRDILLKFPSSTMGV